MYGISLSECQRRRGLLAEIRNEIAAEAPGSGCDCHNRAQASQPRLLERLIAGDDLAVEPILSIYQRCIDAWAKDIYKDPVYESQFKAEIAARFIQECVHLESETLCHRLKVISCEVADDHLRHIEEHHLSQQAARPCIPECAVWS